MIAKLNSDVGQALSLRRPRRPPLNGHAPYNRNRWNPAFLTSSRAERSSLRAAEGCVLLLALALLAQKILIAILDPTFCGDAGIRMNSAARPYFRVGNRVWLPYLQLHIWVFHLLRLPYRLYNLIPCFYFFVAVVSLGLLGLRLLGRTWSGILFTLAVMFCFAEHRLIGRLSPASLPGDPGASRSFICFSIWVRWTSGKAFWCYWACWRC